MSDARASAPLQIVGRAGVAAEGCGRAVLFDVGSMKDEHWGVLPRLLEA